MTAAAIAVPRRVIVRCCKCNTVAAVRVQNLAAWRDSHPARCFVRPMGVVNAELSRAAMAGTSEEPPSAEENDSASESAPSPAVFGDNTPPRPQDVSGSDYAEDDWQSLLESDR